MLPALPTGMQSASSSPSSSTISNAAVFWPSSRNGLTELTSAIGWRCTSSRTSLSAASKLPRSAITRAPCTSAWASLPVAILPSGTITAPRSPARAGVGGGARRGVARRGADDGLGAVAQRGRDRAGHPAVLERAGRVRALDLQPHVGAHALGEPRRGHERRRALEQGDDGVVRPERQPVAVALDDPDAAQVNSSSITRIARGGERMKSSWPISRSAA